MRHPEINSFLLIFARVREWRVHVFLRKSKCAPIELDLAREGNGIVEWRKKGYNFLETRWNVVILCFTCLLHNNCTAVLGRQPKVVAKQTIVEAVAGGLIRLTVLSYMYNTQTILLAFPSITRKLFFHAQYFFRFISRRSTMTWFFNVENRIFVGFVKFYGKPNLGDVTFLSVQSGKFFQRRP